MSASTYTIRTVQDFLTVPAHRRADCIRDFAGWLPLVELAVKLPGVTTFPPYEWIDDGKPGTNVVLRNTVGAEVGRASL